MDLQILVRKENKRKEIVKMKQAVNILKPLKSG